MRRQPPTSCRTAAGMAAAARAVRVALVVLFIKYGMPAIRRVMASLRAGRQAREQRIMSQANGARLWATRDTTQDAHADVGGCGSGAVMRPAHAVRTHAHAHACAYARVSVSAPWP